MTAMTTGSTLLLVEDDARIREALRLALADEGHRVLEAGTGEQALAVLASDDGPEPDVVLLDLMLPGMDGLRVCERIRERGDLPVIMVTARTGPNEVIAGLEAGAADDVTKPVDAGELSARIRALLRRVRAGSDVPAVLEMGELTLRISEGRVLRGDEEIPLTKTEFRLLCTLALARGTVVSREQLLERVWGYGYFGDTRLLDVHIRRLRRKVEPDPGQPTYVLTVRGVGYRSGASGDGTTR